MNFFCNNPYTSPKLRAVDFLNEQLLYFVFENCCVMYLPQMPDKYDTYAKPIPAIYETDISFKKLVCKSRKNQSFSPNFEKRWTILRWSIEIIKQIT